MRVKTQFQIRYNLDAILRYIYDLDGGVKNWLPWRCRYMEKVPVIKINEIIADMLWTS